MLGCNFRVCVNLLQTQFVQERIRISILRSVRRQSVSFPIQKFTEASTRKIKCRWRTPEQLRPTKTSAILFGQRSKSRHQLQPMDSSQSPEGKIRTVFIFHSIVTCPKNVIDKCRCWQTAVQFVKCMFCK